jgi:ribosomal 50S subunit-associated protein YjgA (DUF615 family)
LLNETAALSEFAAEYSDAESKVLERLISQAHHERDRHQPPAASRELFRVLREVMNEGEAD